MDYRPIRCCFPVLGKLVFVWHSFAAGDWLRTKHVVDADWFLQIVGKKPLNGSGFSFQQKLAVEERVTKT